MTKAVSVKAIHLAMGRADGILSPRDYGSAIAIPRWGPMNRRLRFRTSTSTRQEALNLQTWSVPPHPRATSSPGADGILVTAFDAWACPVRCSSRHGRPSKGLRR